MNHSQQQWLRTLVNDFMENETDLTVFTRPLTGVEISFCIMCLNQQEPDLVNDFCEEYIDTFN